MKLNLYINEANDYARDIGVPVLHPHVAIIHYDEAGEIRHSLNRGRNKESVIWVVLSVIRISLLRIFLRTFAA